MTIDWLKYVKDTLPVKLREVRIVQLIHVLIGKVKELHDEINDYTLKARLYVSCTSQVCWLQRMLRSELGDDSITITEGDGLPVDFIVTCDSWVLETQLKGLLNRFKMAGKSYEFRFPNLAYSAQWVNPVCETTSEADSYARWANPVCEILHDNNYGTLLLHKNGEGLPGVIPSLISCSPGQVDYAIGTEITLTAENGPSEYFDHWEARNLPYWDNIIYTRSFMFKKPNYGAIVNAVYSAEPVADRYSLVVMNGNVWQVVDNYGPVNQDGMRPVFFRNSPPYSANDVALISIPEVFDGVVFVKWILHDGEELSEGTTRELAITIKPHFMWLELIYNY